MAKKKKSSDESPEPVESPSEDAGELDEFEELEGDFGADLFAEALAAVEAREEQARQRENDTPEASEDGVVLLFDADKPGADPAAASTINALEAELNTLRADIEVDQKVLSKERRKRQLLEADLRDTLEALQRAESAVRELRSFGTQFQRRLEQAQRRAERDVEQARHFGHESLIKQMLPVLDNLDMASRQTRTGASLEQVMEGVQLIRNSFHQALEQIDVERVDANEGTPFDPNLHEAMMRVPRTDLPDMTVIEEIRAGFLLHGRLLRAARVAVSTGGPKATEPELVTEQEEGPPDDDSSEE